MASLLKPLAAGEFGVATTTGVLNNAAFLIFISSGITWRTRVPNSSPTFLLDNSFLPPSARLMMTPPTSTPNPSASTLVFKASTIDVSSGFTTNKISAAIVKGTMLSLLIPEGVSINMMSAVSRSVSITSLSFSGLEFWKPCKEMPLGMTVTPPIPLYIASSTSALPANTSCNVVGLFSSPRINPRLAMPISASIITTFFSL